MVEMEKHCPSVRRFGETNPPELLRESRKTRCIMLVVPVSPANALIAGTFWAPPSM